MVGHDCIQLRELIENLLFTLADFEVKMLFGIGLEISKPLTSKGNVSPKLKKIETFTNIFQWMTTIFNAIKYFGLVARLKISLTPVELF